MKPQDILFLLVVGFLFYKGRPQWFIYVGLLLLVLAMPLYGFWVFFTAERLVMYAAGCFLSALILVHFTQKKRKR